jgi:hypothetical protein
VCKTVLGERAVAFDEIDDLPKLFKSATLHLPFLPPTASGEAEVRDSLKRTLNGLSTAILGICELRNRCGFASHGSGSPRQPMQSAQALLAAEAADTIVGFLHRVHIQDRPEPRASGPTYAENAAFNDTVDENHGMVRIFDVEFRPSEILFQMEPEGYRVYLAEFDGGAEDSDDATDGHPAAKVSS